MKKDVNRFLDAQQNWYDVALREIKAGRKENHWMWIIFPQLSCLGSSDYSRYYGIDDLDHALEFLANDTLKSRYIECCNALLDLKETNPQNIFGKLDSLKLRSSLTLFYLADEENRELYHKLIDKFYNGVFDKLTFNYLFDASESLLGKIVKVKIDRPLGSVHPKYENIRYGVNYGYLPCVLGGDNMLQDAYVLGVDEPINEFSGKVIAIIHRKNDVEFKLVVVPKDTVFTKEEIFEKVNFQEKFFDVEIETL